jgi:hypothetical protein
VKVLQHLGERAVSGGPGGVRSVIPLTVGVVGHRDPDDIDLLKTAVRSVFTELRDSYAHTSIQVITSLAEGADQLVANVALEMDIDVIAALPMARELFEDDFDADSRREFQNLLGQTVEWFELPLLHDYTLSEIVHSGAARDRQYAFAGAFIVRHSQILLALWDGLEALGEGGTGTTVAFKLRGVPESYGAWLSPLDVPDTGPVKHIITRRKSSSVVSTSAAESGTVRTMFPEFNGLLDERVQRVHLSYNLLSVNIDDFNRRATRLLLRRPFAVAQSDRHLLGETKREKADQNDAFTSDVPASIARIRRVYCIADALAIYEQKLSTRMTALIFIIGAGMVLSFATFSNSMKFPFLALYLCLFLMMIAVHRLGRLRETYDRFLGARALAEGLRVQFFWRMSGSWEEVAHHYLRRHAEELRWIREALRSLGIAAPSHTSLGRRMNWALAWMQTQARYFEESAKTRRRKLRLFSTFAYGLYGLGLAICFLMVVASGLEFELGQGYGIMPKRYAPALDPLLVTLMGLGPALAALWMGYAEFMSFEEDTRQHSRMHSLFVKAERGLIALKEASEGAAVPGGSSCTEDAQLADRMHGLLHNLGNEALRENGDWLLMHRSRPPKPEMT